MRAEASLPPAEFLARFAPAIRARQISIGCSFAPEQFEGVKGAGEIALRALRIAVEELGITDIRLGLRWDRLAPEGAILAYYEPYLDYCFASPTVRHVVLDLGPIKTFRWPEVHVPEAVIASLASVPADRASITPRDELAQRSFDHFARALEYVGSMHPATRSVSICFNEPFHRFGTREWTMSEAYLAELVRIVEESGLLPGCSYIVNSAQGLQLDRIAAFFEDLAEARASLRARLVSGFDLYPFLPPVVATPVLRELLGAARAIRRRWYAQARRNIERAQAGGYRIEVTEAQAEPYGNQQAVGNSIAHYQHVLAECINGVLNPAQPASVIRMWGVEYQTARVLSRTASDANRQILELTRDVNALTAKSP